MPDNDRQIKEYRPRLNVYVLWHPKDESTHDCRKYAAGIYSHLNRDVKRPYSTGIGIPVYYRFLPAGGPGSSPMTIDLDKAEQNAVYALVAPEFVMDEAWNNYCSDMHERIQRRGKGDIVIPMALTKSALNLRGFGGIHAVRMYEVAGGLRMQQMLRKISISLCDLLSPRDKPSDSTTDDSIRKLKLFISHTKRTPESLQLAEALRKVVETSEIDRYFDSVDTRPGRYFVDEIMKHLDTSAIVALRSDAYSASPWCCMEVIKAKGLRRPMIVVDSLVDIERRNLPFLGNLPCIRFDPSPKGEYDSPEMQARLETVIDFALTEVLRFVYTREHLAHLKAQEQFAWLPKDAIALERAPEPIDIVQICRNAGPWNVVYDGDTLAPQIRDELERSDLTLATPSTVGGKSLEGITLGISISESEDLEIKGLSEDHLKDAMKAVSAAFLEKGVILAYGGDLRPGGFTEYLFELADSLRRAGQEDLKLILNFLAWPIHLKVSTDKLADYNNVAQFTRLDPPQDLLDAQLIRDNVFIAPDTPAGGYVWARSLTEMRERMMERIDARIIIGGRLTGYSGKYPGLVEEALLAIQSKEPFPLFLLGGFGGAAAVVIEALKGLKPSALTDEYQCESKAYAGRMDFYNRQISNQGLDLEPIDYAKLTQDFKDAGIKGLRNGLTDRENEQLFAAQNMELAIKLIEEGLKRVHVKAPKQ